MSLDGLFPNQADNTELDKIALDVSISRKVSPVLTSECTVYDSFDQLWKESDADFRERILAEVKSNG